MFGSTVVSPETVLNNKDIKLVCSTDNKCWKNQLTHYPLGIGLLGGVAEGVYLGSIIGHPIACAALGAAGGFGIALGIMKIAFPSLFAKKFQEIRQELKAESLAQKQMAAKSIEI